MRKDNRGNFMVDNNDKKIKIDNTIKALYEVLEKNKNNPNIKKTFEDIEKLAKKRGVITTD